MDREDGTVTRPAHRPPSRRQAIVVALVVGAVFIAGLAIHGPLGGVLLLLVDAALIALSRAMWHAISNGRGLRIVVIVVVAALAVVKLAGKA
jgi:uncharacterized membrane protein YdbT with pleckstrin-like domain